MNGGILPLLLIAATVGFALGAAPARVACWSIVAMGAAAILLSFVPIPPEASQLIFTGVWTSVIGTGALTYVPASLIRRLGPLAAVNAGAWSGALAALSEMRAGLVLAILFALLALPARWLALRGHHIVIKVAASWMIAIASLSMFVSFLPTPGYKLDHME